MSNILVTGATGTFGKYAAEFLLKKNTDDKIAALVRNPDKALELREKGVEIRIGNYNDISSLEKAFEGIDKVLFISSSEIADRVKQHENIVNALKRAKINHVVYTSFQRKNETDTSPISFVSKSHLLTEKWLKESGLNYTIMQNTVYMDMLPLFMGQKVIETGNIIYPAGEGKSAFATRKDMAEAAANILTSENHGNKVYKIFNVETFTLKEAADILSSITGKKIIYVSPSQEDYRKALKDAGLPQDAIDGAAGFGEAIKQGEFEETSKDLENLLGRMPTSINEFLTSVYKK